MEKQELWYDLLINVSKMGVLLNKHRSESQWTVLLGYVTISTNVRCYYHVVYNNFVFQQSSTPGAFCIQSGVTAAVQNSALKQQSSAKLCGVLWGMELRNVRRGHHLYSAGRPSRWASAHILVCFVVLV